MKSIRMLALDVDGTLAARGDEVTPRTREALSRASKCGLEVVIATGRRYRTTRRVVDSLGMPVAAVCLGGALIKDQDERTLFSGRFSETDFCDIHRLAREMDLALVGHLDSHTHGGADFVVDSDARWNKNLEAYVETNRDYAELRPFAGGAIHEDAIVLGTFAGKPVLSAFQQELEARYEGRFFSNIVPSFGVTEWYIDIIPAHISKWSGLRHLAGDRGVGVEEICAVGDQVNDLPMIRGAGIGVAMGNAAEEVKRAADLVTGRNDEDGIADLVDELLGR